MAENMPTMGWQYQCGIGLESVAGVAVTPTEFVELRSETMGYAIDRQDLVGLSGKRGHHKQAVVDGTIDGGGDLVFLARTSLLGNFLYWAMGGGNNTAPSLANGIKPLTIEMDRKVYVFTYAGCKINQMQMQSSANNPVEVTASILPMSIAVGAAGSETTPDYGTTQNSPILMHHTLTLTYGGQTITCHSCNLTINNALEDDHWENSQSRTALPEGDRIITVNFGINWNVANMTTKAVWTNFVASNGTNAALTYALTDGSTTWTFTMSNLELLTIPPASGGRGRVAPEVTAEAKSSAITADDALTIAMS